MSLRYVYELIAPAARADRLVAALLPHLCRADRMRLRAALPWRPERSEMHHARHGELVPIRHGIAGLSRECERHESYCLGMLFHPDDAVREYEDMESFRGIDRLDTEVGRVHVGCVWVTLRAGQALCVLEAAAATSSMSSMFRNSPNVRQTFRRIARAARALALFFDAEEEDLVLCVRRERAIAQPDYEPYELDEIGEVHVDGYYGALLAAAGVRPLAAAP